MTTSYCRQLLTHPNQLLPRQALSLPVDGFMRDLLDTSLVLIEDWERLTSDVRGDLTNCCDGGRLLPQLVEHGLLTEYQAARIEAGTTFGLILGNYRVLERIGAGGMGVVFKAEHVEMRRLVAIKVLAVSPGQDPRMLQRFLTEIRAVARLHHPNIVAAIDTGKVQDNDPDAPVLRYFVMEYVAGQDLEEFVCSNGPLDPARVCDLMHQVASALAESHKFDLVHRDIKPSNILVTPEHQAKLLDFGLTHQFGQRLTEPGTVLGTLDFMAPEQAHDASSVDGRADIYGLGATLFWCLTGEVPFPSEGHLTKDLVRRLTQPPPSARAVCSRVSPELDAVLARMMALKPEERYPTPQVLMRALLPFLRQEARDHLILQTGAGEGEPRLAHFGAGQAKARIYQVLIVDDEPGIRNLCRIVLQADGMLCDESASGIEALEAVNQKAYDLVLLDINMPDMTGIDVLRQLRETPTAPHQKAIMISGRFSSDEMAQVLAAGADDYLTKPFSMVQLQARIKSVLRLKDAQDRSELLNRHLLAANAQLEQNLNVRDCDLVHARNALVLALAKLVANRDTETGGHLQRLQRYCRCLAEEAACSPSFAGQIDQNFIEMLECCAPLHDIGKVGLPDHILMKPGKLTADERIMMQAHTAIGAETLQGVAQQYRFAIGFLQMAVDITRHHHERYDGTGYPDRLAGSAIPLTARLVALGDVYDALRSRRSYKPALSHASAVQMILEGSPGHFDPALLVIFERCAGHFENIFREVTD